MFYFEFYREAGLFILLIHFLFSYSEFTIIYCLLLFLRFDARMIILGFFEIFFNDEELRVKLGLKEHCYIYLLYFYILFF
jgi:hypothetical protein